MVLYHFLPQQTIKQDISQNGKYRSLWCYSKRSIGNKLSRQFYLSVNHGYMTSFTLTYYPYGSKVIRFVSGYICYTSIKH